MSDGEIIRGNTEPDTKKPNSKSYDEDKQADDETRKKHQMEIPAFKNKEEKIIRITNRTASSKNWQKRRRRQRQQTLRKEKNKPKAENVEEQQ